ncbi:hypothetical protein X734_22955 [Mesorhizobium sp. L2C084A000]|nr:hypothetical protein X734_22955 [Mesorhizobium sp. L2C084A000]
MYFDPPVTAHVIMILRVPNGAIGIKLDPVLLIPDGKTLLTPDRETEFWNSATAVGYDNLLLVMLGRCMTRSARTI